MDKVEEIKSLLLQVVQELVDRKISPLAAKRLAQDPTLFEREFMEQYISHENLEHGTFREWLRWFKEQYKPYNVPYSKEFVEGDWEGEAPYLSITIPANVHNLIGAIEVNVYDAEGNIVYCDTEVDAERNIIIRSATPFSGALDIFCAVGETPEAQHRQPIYTVNKQGPDKDGNIAMSGDGTIIVSVDDPGLAPGLLFWYKPLGGTSYALYAANEARTAWIPVSLRTNGMDVLLENEASVEDAIIALQLALKERLSKSELTDKLQVVLNDRLIETFKSAGKITVDNSYEGDVPDGSELAPFKTIAAASAEKEAEASYIFDIRPGRYSENLNIANITNRLYQGYSADQADRVEISGAINITGDSGKLGFRDLLIVGDINIDSTGTIYFVNCAINGNITLSGSNYVVFKDCDIMKDISITGAHTVLIDRCQCENSLINQNATGSMLTTKDCLGLTISGVLGSHIEYGNSTYYPSSAQTDFGAKYASTFTAVYLISGAAIDPATGGFLPVCISGNVPYYLGIFQFDTQNSILPDLAYRIEGGIGANQVTARKQRDNINPSASPYLGGVLDAIDTTVGDVHNKAVEMAADPTKFQAATAKIETPGTGYVVGDTVVTVDGVQLKILDLSVNADLQILNGSDIYTADPSGSNKSVTGGSGTGMTVIVQTVYAPGDVNVIGSFKHVRPTDPLVQASWVKKQISDGTAKAEKFVGGVDIADIKANIEATVPTKAVKALATDTFETGVYNTSTGAWEWVSNTPKAGDFYAFKSNADGSQKNGSAIFQADNTFFISYSTEVGGTALDDVTLGLNAGGEAEVKDGGITSGKLADVSKVNTTSNGNPGFGGTITIPTPTFNSKGQQTGVDVKTVTLPGLGVTAVTAASGNDPRIVNAVQKVISSVQGNVAILKADGSIADSGKAYPTSLPANGGTADSNKMHRYLSGDMIEIIASNYAADTSKTFIFSSVVTNTPENGYWWVVKVEYSENTNSEYIAMAYKMTYASVSQFAYIRILVDSVDTGWVSINDGGNAAAVNGKKLDMYVQSAEPANSLPGDIWIKP